MAVLPLLGITAEGHEGTLLLETFEQLVVSKHVPDNVIPELGAFHVLLSKGLLLTVVDIIGETAIEVTYGSVPLSEDGFDGTRQHFLRHLLHIGIAAMSADEEVVLELGIGNLHLHAHPVFAGL